MKPSDFWKKAVGECLLDPSSGTRATMQVSFPIPTEARDRLMKQLSSAHEVTAKLLRPWQIATPVQPHASFIPARNPALYSTTFSACSSMTQPEDSIRQQALEMLCESCPNSARSMRSELNAMPTSLLLQMLMSKSHGMLRVYDQLPRVARDFLKDELKPYRATKAEAISRTA